MSLAVPSKIAAAATANSPAQLESLFRTHYERVARVIGRVIHDQSRAEEIAVDVFLKWTRNPKAHGPGAEGWIYRAAVREALDELRRQTRRERFDWNILASWFSKAALKTPEQQHAAERDRIRVHAVLAKLDSRAASLLLLWSEDLSYSEIAAALDLQSNYVGSLLSRAQDAFRKEFLKQYGTTGHEQQF